MKIDIIAIGYIKNSPENELINHYLKQIPQKINIKEIEIKKKLDPELLMKQEAIAIIADIPKNSHIIICDTKGKEQTSHEFANYIHKFPHLTFIIGGAFGIDDFLREKGHFLLSFSKMTMPHKFARLMLVEQIYRSNAILNNHPYSK